MKKTFYKPFHSFVLRSPLYPLEAKDFDAYKNSDCFREAIFLASPELFNGNNSSDPKKQEKFDHSLQKYFHRASTRCTPFGLFAGCSVGRIGEQTRIELEKIENYKRCTRLDMQYLCALIQEIERLPELRTKLLYFPNDSLYRQGGKYRYIEYRYKKTQRLHQVVALEIDEALEQILSLAAKGATIQELSSSFVNQDISYEDAVTYVNEVIESQVLKSELDPCVVGEDVLKTLIVKLSRFGQISILNKLHQIQKLLSEIDAQPIGSTLPLYTEIMKVIRDIGVGFEEKYLFQTDLYIPVKEAVVSKQTTDRLANLIHFLARISPAKSSATLTEFARAFQKRYEEREIPLAEVLDRELGLGYPLSGSRDGDVSPLVEDIILPYQQSNITEIHQSPADRILFRKYVDCIRNGQNKVILSDDDFKDFSFMHTFPDTFAVMCSLTNQNELFIRSIGGSSGVNLLGRFCHLDADIEKLVREVVEYEQKSNPDVIYAEISHLQESRIGNIASRPAVREYTLHYLSNFDRNETNIAVTDLMLSFRDGRLFLRSKKYDKEIAPRLTCAHNYSLSPIPIYRFLCDMQYQGKTGGLQCGWGAPVAEMDYLPRIEYKGIILSRQQWKIKLEEVKGFDKLSEVELDDKMRQLLQARGIPDSVVIPDNDNELFLDFRDRSCQRIFLTTLAKRKGIVIEEFLFDRSHSVVRSEGRGYTNEMIFVFHK